MSERIAGKKTGSIWDYPELREYLGEVARRHGVVDTLALPNMRDLPPIQIEKLFVQPELSPKPFSSETTDWSKGESLLDCLTYNRSVVLLGDPGSGKTTLINWLSWRLSSGFARGLPKFCDDLLPIPCILREIEPSKFVGINNIGGLALLVAERLLGSKLGEDTKNTINEYVSAHKYILMLDGLDEISIESRKIVAAWISFAKKNNAYVVATSRIVGYDELPVHRSMLEMEVYFSHSTNVVNDQESVFQVDHIVPKNIDFKKSELQGNMIFENEIPSTIQWATLRYLMPFDDQRIEDFINNWYLQRSAGELDASERSADLLAALKQSKATHELARTPNLLSLISIVHRERAHLPDGRALLYREISNAYINTIDSQRKIKIDNDLLRHDWTVREGWISYVGFKMQIERTAAGDGKKFGLLVAKKKVLSWLEEVMAPYFPNNTSQYAMVFLDWVARRSGLLLPKGENRYAFVHLSFQEYFCARYMSSKVVSPKFIKGVFSSEDIVSYDALRLWSKNSLWRESFIYFFELISSESGLDWVTFVIGELFFPKSTKIGIYDESAVLVSRILANIHVVISEEDRNSLAIKCSCNDNYEVEGALARAGFAISISRPRNNTGSELIVDPKIVLHDFAGGEKVYKISIFDRKLKSYSDFKKFENVVALNLVDCELTSLSFLRSMKNLKQLRLDGSKIKSVNSISNLSELRYLYLKGTNISDLSLFKNNVNLVTITLDSTEIIDVSALEKFPNLLYISLSNTNVFDISCLRFNDKVMYLYLDGIKARDFSVLKRMPTVNRLNLARSNFKDIDLLCDMKDLAELNLSLVPDLDLSSLSRCKSLKVLILNGASSKQLYHLSALDWLEELWLMDVDITSLDFVSGLKSLKKLVLDGSSVRDIAPLRNSHNLEYLDIDNTDVSDVSILSNLKNLKTLHVRNSNVRSIESLNKKAGLNVLGFPS